MTFRPTDRRYRYRKRVRPRERTLEDKAHRAIMVERWREWVDQLDEAGAFDRRSGRLVREAWHPFWRRWELPDPYPWGNDQV